MGKCSFAGGGGLPTGRFNELVLAWLKSYSCFKVVWVIVIVLLVKQIFKNDMIFFPWFGISYVEAIKQIKMITTIITL